MLYHFFEWINRVAPFPGSGVFQYLTFRAVLAAVFSLLISLVLGGYIIGLLRRQQVGESIRDHGPETHKKKAGTPTMGGVIIIAAIIIPTLLWGNLSNMYVLLVVLATLWMGVVGFIDDYIKVFKKDKRGLKGRLKIVGQVGLGLIVGGTMLLHPHFQGKQIYLENDRVVRVNDLLIEAGFAADDRLLEVNDKSLESVRAIEGNVQVVPYRQYRVSRLNRALKQRETTTIDVPAGLRQDVAQLFFGAAPKGFLTQTNMPFFKDYVFDYSRLAFWTDDPEHWSVRLIYLLIVIFIITAVSNGANITDGIDGLAAGTTAIVATALGIFAYISGNIVFAGYLDITFIPMSGELFVFAAALIGACIGFLWYNTHPAQVFMGDTGSLAIGSAVAVLALMIKKELLLPLVCGIFFIETISVMLQVTYFKYTKRKYGQGRRIFRMAPLHHHFELGGLHESKIVTRFWIVCILLEILAFATLKLR